MTSSRLVVGLAIAATLVSVGCAAETRPATDIDQDSATLHAYAAWDEGQEGAWWFRYREAGSTTWTNETPHNPFAMGAAGNTDDLAPADPLTATISGLNSSTRYEYQFCVEAAGPDPPSACWNSEGEGQEDALSTFTTCPTETAGSIYLDNLVDEAEEGDRLVLPAGDYGRVDTSEDFGQDGLVVQAAEGARVTTRGWRFRSGASNVVVRGLEIREPNVCDYDDTSAAVRVDAGASDITIEQSKLAQGSHGLRVVGSSTNYNASPSNITLRDSEITGPTDGTVTGPGTTEDPGITIDAVAIGGGHDIVIDNNDIHDIDLSWTPPVHHDGVQVFRGRGITISRNRIFSTATHPSGLSDHGIIAGRQDGTLDPDREVADVKIYSNLVHQWPGTGIVVTGVTGATVRHNTSFNSGNGANGSFVMGPTSDQSATVNTKVRIANNIFERVSMGAAWDSSENDDHDECQRNIVVELSPASAASNCYGTIVPEDESDIFELNSEYYPKQPGPAANVANTSYGVPSAIGDLDNATRTSAVADIGAREAHPVRDTFIGTSGLLSAHTGESGSGWTKVTGDPGTASLSANAVVPTESGTVFSYTPTAWTPTDNTYAAEAIVVNRSPIEFRYGGPVCRWSTTTSSKSGYYARLHHDQLELLRFDPGNPGTNTVLASTALPAEYTEGRSFRLSLYCGAMKEVYVDGQLMLSDSDNTVTQIGKPGVRGNSTRAPLDSFSAFDL